jgi:hypothetical protein
MPDPVSKLWPDPDQTLWPDPDPEQMLPVNQICWTKEKILIEMIIKCSFKKASLTPILAL